MILPWKGKYPEIHETSFVAPSADVIGDVILGENSSIWFQCVVRGDVNNIRIGNRTNIQDHSVLHVTRKTAPLLIGDEVTVGHRATLHGCKVGNRVLVGMGAVILDNAEIGDDSIIGAGALITQNKKYPPNSLIIGSPAKVARSLTGEEIGYLKVSADNYVKDAHEYASFVRGPRIFGKNNDDLEDVDHDDLVESID